jgi:hypothetical protein
MMRYLYLTNMVKLMDQLLRTLLQSSEEFLLLTTLVQWQLSSLIIQGRTLMAQQPMMMTTES